MIKNNNEKIVRQIYKKLTSYKKVSIFPHDVIDNDAYGSSLALAKFLRSMKIDARIAGLEKGHLNDIKSQLDKNYMQVVDEKFARNSIAIVLDLGVSKNLISDKFYLCKESLRIDHHPFVEKFCDIEWVDTEYCSTCEMIGWFILFNNEKKMTKDIVNSLYVGILTDSGNLMFPSAKASSYNLVSKFFDYNFDKQKKQEEIYLKDWHDVKTNQKLIKYIKTVDDKIAYLVITPRMQKKYNLSEKDTKVYLMAGVKEFEVWFSMYYNKEKKKWKVSIRSRKYPVREVALKYDGGGHILASGFMIESLKQIDDIIDQIKKLF